MTTRSLDRFTGVLDGGEGWSVVAETLHPAHCSDGWSQIPPPFRSQVLEDPDWRDEPRLFRCGLADALPDGLRFPRLWYAHGDAAPDNFREPGDGTVVAIGWSYGSVAPTGADLAQLLVGRFESGVQDPGTAPDVLPAVVEGFLAGTAEEGVAAESADVELGLAAHLAVRSLFSLLLVERRDDLPPPDRETLLARRARFGRFGIDLVLACDPAG